MNKQKPFIYKRILAYIIDLLVVVLISGIITVVFVDNKKYDKDVDSLMELTEKLQKEEITTEEYYEEFDNINYYLTKNSTVVTIITCVVSIIYYVILCYYCGGITLGKHIMKIRIVSYNEKSLHILNYLSRSLIINFILSNSISVILVKVLSKNDFILYNTKINNVLFILIVVSFILIMYRDDGRGIEDFMANTKIINYKDEIEVSKEEITEASIVDEVKKEKSGKKERK